MLGRRATAPCGHTDEGEVVFGTFVKCKRKGCDGSAPRSRAKTEPGHGAARGPCPHDDKASGWEPGLNMFVEKCLNCGASLRKWRK